MASAVRDYTNSGTPASATGLTGLDQSGANFTIAFWYFLPTQGTGGGIWSHCNAGTSRDGIAVRIQLIAGQGNRKMRVVLMTGSAATNVTSVQPVFLPGWHHYALRYNGAMVWFIRHGIVVDAVASAVVPTAAGTRNTVILQNGGVSDARLYDLRVFPNVALNLAEIRLLQDPRAIVQGCKQRLFLNWTPGANGTVKDESGSGNDLVASANLEECDAAEPPPWRSIMRRRRLYKAPAAAAYLGQDLGHTPQWQSLITT